MTPPKLTPCKPASFVVVDRVVTCRHTRRGMINGNPSHLELTRRQLAGAGEQRLLFGLAVPEPAEQSRALRDLEVGRRRRRPRMQHARERGREGQRPRDLVKKPSIRGVRPSRKYARDRPKPAHPDTRSTPLSPNVLRGEAKNLGASSRPTSPHQPPCDDARVLSMVQWNNDKQLRSVTYTMLVHAPCVKERPRLLGGSRRVAVKLEKLGLQFSRRFRRIDPTDAEQLLAAATDASDCPLAAAKHASLPGSL